MKIPRATNREGELRRAVIFLAAAGLILLYSLRGGSYDIVVRESHGVVLWAGISLALLTGAVRRISVSRAGLSVAGSLLLLAAWSGAGLSWTESDERGLAEVVRCLDYLGVVTLVMLVLDRDTWRAAAAGVSAAMLAVCCLALLSRLAPASFPENHIREVFASSRLGYPFAYWNALAAWCAMGIAVALAWSADAQRGVIRAVAGAVIPVCGLALYLTYSRAGLAGAGLAVLLVVALCRRRGAVVIHAAAGVGTTLLLIELVRDQREIALGTGGSGAGSIAIAVVAAGGLCAGATLLSTRLGSLMQRRLPRVPRPPRTAGIAAGVLVCAVGAALLSGPAARAWEEFRTVDRAVPRAGSDPAARLSSFGGERYDLWRSTLDAFQAEPLHGIGPGSFEFWWGMTGGQAFLRDAHSLYLEQLAELGIPGGALVLVLVLSGIASVAAMALGRGRPAVGAAPVAMGSVFCVFAAHAGIDWIWESTAVTVSGLLAVAVLVQARARPVVLRGGTRLAAGLTSLCILAVHLPGLVSTSLVRESQAAARSGDPARAHELAVEAVQVQPWAASPFVQRALVYEQAGRLASAAQDLHRAAVRERTNWRHPLLLARIEAERGRTAQALSAYRRARALRPKGAFFGQ